MMAAFTESGAEEAALDWLKGLGYAALHGPAIAVGEPGADRRDPGSAGRGELGAQRSS